MGEKPITTCRDEMLWTIQNLVKKKGENRFTIEEVLIAMKAAGTTYKDSTIRTHLTNKCCVGKSQHHQTVYNDYHHIERGLYSLVIPPKTF